MDLWLSWLAAFAVVWFAAYKLFGESTAWALVLLGPGALALLMLAGVHP